jgi:hypothetical protein
MLVTYVLHQNFTAGYGGVRAWFSAPRSREIKFSAASLLVPEKFGRERVRLA